MTYTTEQQEFIKVLERKIKTDAIKMAVVDYIGKNYQKLDGSFATVDETTENEERFGVRSARDVKGYDLTVITYNRIEACEGFGSN